MPADEQTKFLQQLAEDLNSKNIRLPSFPDVVLNIRTALEDPSCTSERLVGVVKTDPVLVARLLISANSAFHNRAGIEIVDLNLAISRLGFEVVRNTAITLAVEQIFNATLHEKLHSAIKAIWSSSTSLASMCFVIAQNTRTVNPDNAFLSGLLHEIGKLYILTKASDYPKLLGDIDSLNNVIDLWYTSVGKSIIEAWGFSNDIAESVEYADNLNEDENAPATLMDVVFAAKWVLQDSDEQVIDGAGQATIARIKIDADNLPAVRKAYDLHAQSMRN